MNGLRLHLSESSSSIESPPEVVLSFSDLDGNKREVEISSESSKQEPKRQRLQRTERAKGLDLAYGLAGIDKNGTYDDKLAQLRELQGYRYGNKALEIMYSISLKNNIADIKEIIELLANEGVKFDMGDDICPLKYSLDLLEKDFYSGLMNPYIALVIRDHIEDRNWFDEETSTGILDKCLSELEREDIREDEVISIITTMDENWYGCYNLLNWVKTTDDLVRYKTVLEKHKETCPEAVSDLIEGVEWRIEDKAKEVVPTKVVEREDSGSFWEHFLNSL